MQDALQNLNFSSYPDALLPAVVQDYITMKVLTLGFMNEEALRKTQETAQVTLYDRRSGTIWIPGEENGNPLQLRQILVDCDHDSLLIKVQPGAPVCHTGAETCWSEKNHKEDFLYYLEDIIRLRRLSGDQTSAVVRMFEQGTGEIAGQLDKKTREVLGAAGHVNRELFLEGAAGLLFHYLLLLQVKDCSLNDVIEVLKQRHQRK